MSGSTTATTSTAAATPREGIKETIESIIIAFILAFVFRAFVVEAFIIPTGSMAPTLYGAHGTIACRDCGTEFAYGLHDPTTGRSNNIKTDSRAICPNCNHRNTGLVINDVAGNAERGDRILVFKFPFDIGGDLLGPRRWDVVVFKDPSDGDTNFIKRLVGLPNEVLMLVDGDLYAVPVDKLSERTLEALDRLREEKHLLRTGETDDGLPSPPAFMLEELDEKLAIARKTRVAQQALWFPIYDHDYPPREPSRNQPHWRAARGETSGWDTSRRCIRFEPAADNLSVPDSIELFGRPLVIACSYNVDQRPASRTPVSDLRVRFVLTPQDAGGLVRLRLEKHGRVFWADLNMDGLVTLTEATSSDQPSAAHSPLVSAKLDPFVTGQSVEVAFAHVDYRIALSVGGREVLATSAHRNDPSYYGPDVKLLRTKRHAVQTVRPRIQASGGRFELTHLAVDRDSYYTDARLGGDWQTKGWGTSGSPMLLRGDEFFMLGDNTTASKDSRLWDRVAPQFAHRGARFQLGTVPRDQLIGKAFFVYWPSGYRLSWLPGPLGNIGIIPDVGRMRWIR